MKGWLCLNALRLIPSPESLYDLMDTTPEADSAQLKAAFRKKVKELHPDMNPEVSHLDPVIWHIS